MMQGAVHTRMSAREFLELPETMKPIQLIHGEVVELPGPSLLHQRMLGDLHIFLNSLIPNGVIFLAPTDLHLGDDNVFQPDLLWIAKDNPIRATGQFLEGAPNLVVEIISPGSVVYDRSDKFEAYEHYQVPEYWIVYPMERLIEVWHLVDGRYSVVGIFSKQDTLISPQLGQAKLDHIFAE
jgi:Uma2 family endonuclease